MLKEFTLNKIEEEVISDTKGRMTFHLKDEHGVIRKVTGNTMLDEHYKPVSITAEKKREHPLIICLFHTAINETIRIEFTQYNEVFGRKKDDAVEPTVNEIYEEMQKKPLRIGDLLEFSK